MHSDLVVAHYYLVVKFNHVPLVALHGVCFKIVFRKYSFRALHSVLLSYFQEYSSSLGWSSHFVLKSPFCDQHVTVVEYHDQRRL